MFSLNRALAALILGVAMWAAAAHALPAPKPLSKADVIDLLKGGVSAARVGELAHERGIDFQITSEVERELRQAGATDALIATFRDLAPQGQGIQFEVMPGDAEVYVDDERVGKTSPEGRLKIPTLTPGQHRIRISLDGYRDYEKSIEVKRGEMVRIVASLQGFNTPSNGQSASASSSNIPVLLNKVVAAVGGKEKLRTIRSFRLRGNVVIYLPQGATPGELEMVFDFSGRIWQRFSTTSTAITMVVTSTSGFISSPAGTQDMPIVQRNELLKNVWRNAFYVLQHTDDPTFSFISEGTAVVGGVTAETLDIAGAGVESRWFIDPRTGFILRASWLEMGTTPAEIVDDYADWEPVGGTYVPFKLTSTRNGQTQSTGTFTEVEVNPRIDPNLFARPAR